MKIILQLLVATALVLGEARNAVASASSTSTNRSYTVIESVYKAANGRDPFTPPGQTAQAAKSSPAGPMVFRLDGILYEVNNPSASINGRLVRLNKVVTINTGGGDVPVKAVEITREKVVLEVNGQRVELKISPPK